METTDWGVVDSAPVPGSGGTMRLMRRGDEIVICVDERELMSNTAHGSEDALADLACDRLGPTALETAKVLVGGLGMGFTLAAALRRVGREGQVTVAELVPAVVTWNRGIAGEAAGFPLRDARAVVHEGDVAALMRATAGTWDAILLDVDNGPKGLTRATNHWLYTWEGLEAAFDALRPGGVLGVWSAHPENGFTRRMRRAGFNVTQSEVRARGKAGGRLHVIWMGTRHAEKPTYYGKG